MFSGGNSSTPPFITAAGVTEGNYQGGTVTRSTDIDLGVSVTINDRGDTLFGDPAAGVPGIITSLRNLRDGLAGAGAEAPSQILSTRLTDLVNAGSQVEQARVTVAGRLGQIDRATQRHLTLRSQLQTQQDAAQAIDPNEAAATLLALQTSIQAAYSATSRVLSTSLVNYLP
jgi:flagellin-like hook-associated protein FlgL